MPVKASVTRSRSAISVATLPEGVVGVPQRGAGGGLGDRRQVVRQPHQQHGVDNGRVRRSGIRAAPPANAKALLMVRVTTTLVGYSSTSWTALGWAENSP